MAESTITGTRIRERRLVLGLRQSALAARAGISPSYLNLIEHNRRRIGGKILLRLAEALKVEPQALSHGAEAALMVGLREAAGDGGMFAGRAPAPGAPAPELVRLEEFIGRFPGWAQLLLAQFREGQDRAQMVQALTDRLAHDPHLAASIHEVISVVTAIRSTAAILVETKALEPEWQARFHRNINEDSQRLAEGATSLVRYLDAAPGQEAAGVRSPQDEVDLFLEANGFHFAAIETGGAAAIDGLLDAADVLSLPGAQQMARIFLERYAQDAAHIPLQALSGALSTLGPDPAALAALFNVDLPRVFRRLGLLPPDLAGPIGLVIVDGSGALLLARPIDGFSVSRMGGTCPLWPVFRVLAQPGVPLRMAVQQSARDSRPVTALAITEALGPPDFNAPPLVRAYMLLLPGAGAGAGARAGVGTPEPAPVGTSCRICPAEGCAARREPSILSMVAGQNGERP